MAALAGSPTIPDILLKVFPDTPQRMVLHNKHKNNVLPGNNTLLGTTTKHLTNAIGFNTSKPPRAIYETTSAKLQCAAALGIAKKHAYKLKCNVCALPMSNMPGFTPECDHILPIAQAVMFTELEQSKRVSKKRKTMPSTIRKNLIYQWLHIICNRIKLDWVFIKLMGNKYVPDEEKLKNNLWNLWNSRYFTDQYDFSYLKNSRIQTNGQTNFTYALWMHYKKEYHTTYKKDGTFEEVCNYFIDTRCKAIIDEVYQPLCDHLNSYNNLRLLQLAAVTAAAAGPTHISVNTPTLTRKHKSSSNILSPRAMGALQGIFGPNSPVSLSPPPSKKPKTNGGTRRHKN